MSPIADSPRLPVIDLSLFDAGDPWRDHVAAQVDWAASEFGLFYVIGHGIEPAVIDSLLAQPAGVQESALDYVSALTGLGHRLMTSIGRGLRLGDHYFVDRYTGNPSTRYLIFSEADGMYEHKDEGLLRLLHQDDLGGLQLKHGSAWIDAPYVAGSFVVNVGEALERLTSGRYLSATHRVVNCSGRSRALVPFYFGVHGSVEVQPIAGIGPVAASSAPTQHWDGVDLSFQRRYCEYAALSGVERQ